MLCRGSGQSIEHGQTLLFQSGGAELRFATEERAHARGGRLAEAAQRAATPIQRQTARGDVRLRVDDRLVMLLTGDYRGWGAGRVLRSLAAHGEQGGHVLVVLGRFLLVVHEMASGAVRAKPGRVVRPAQLRLVLGMASQIPQLGHTMRELTFVAIFAHTKLLVRPAQLSFVPGSVDGSGRSSCRCGRGC